MPATRFSVSAACASPTKTSSPTCGRSTKPSASDGFEAEWIDQLDPPLDRLTRAAIRHPRDGSLQPARWVRRLAARAVAAGAEIVEESRIGSLGEVEADRVVIATDGYTSGLVPELDEAIRPIRGQVIATEPLGRMHYPCPHYARRGFDYWQQTHDTRLVLGGRRDKSPDLEHTNEEATTDLIQDELTAFAGELVGEPPRITYRWAGSSARPKMTCRSSAPFRDATAYGSRPATPAMATCSASRAASSSERPCSGAAARARPLRSCATTQLEDADWAPMPSGTGALSSDCQTENLLPSVSVPCANQPMLGTGIFSSIVAAGLADALDLGVDVVDLEVDLDALLAVGRRIQPAAGLALEHVVLGRALGASP